MPPPRREDFFQEIDGIKRAINRLERSTVDDSQLKIPFPLAAGWADLGGLWEGATYSKQDRVVRLQGVVTKSGGTPGGANVIGTFPLGFRPTSDLMFIVWTGSTPAQAGRVDVQASTGNLLWQAGATGETDFTNLSGISFVVD